MTLIKTWQVRQAETGIGSVEAKDDEIRELRQALTKPESEPEGTQNVRTPASERAALATELRGITPIDMDFSDMTDLADRAAAMLEADAKYRTHCAEYANVQSNEALRYQRRIHELKVELEQAQQVAVPQGLLLLGYVDKHYGTVVHDTGSSERQAVYTLSAAPQPAAYVPLTDAEIDTLVGETDQLSDFARAIEQAVRGKT